MVMWTLLLAGCSEWGLGRAGRSGPGGEVPAIEVRPARVDFGLLAGGLEAVATLTVTNVGGNDSVLEVSDLSLSGDADFTILDPPGSFRLPAGRARTVDVRFSPRSPDAHAGAALFASDDPDAPLVEVPLLGNGAHPELQLVPDPLDLGEVPVGCTVEGELDLRSVGAFDLRVEGAALAGTGFTLATPLVESLVLPVGSAQPVRVRFAPVAEGAHEGELVVTSDEPAGRRSALMRGVGTVQRERVDRFVLEADPAADLLFFVDQSWSMRDDAAALASNFDALIARLDSATPNWRLVVVNDDNACERSGVLDRSVPGYAEAFRAAVASGGGSMTEAGLSVVARALELMAPDECNEGMLREGTPLHVIFVTDEAESSPGAWEDYVRRMQAALGEAWRLRISTVGGPIPDGCVTATNSATAALRYVDATTATSGAFLSICSPWSESLDTLAEVSVRRDTFGLSGTPAPGTVRVEVDGSPATAWRYDEGTNAVVFADGALPREGQTVSITWTEARVCP